MKSLDKPHIGNLLIILHIILAVFGFYSFMVAYRLSETLLIQKTLSKQHVLAKAGSLGVENLLKNLQNQLSAFVFSFAYFDPRSPIDLDATRAEFASYMSTAPLPVTGIALYDRNGKLAVIENRIHVANGEQTDFSNAEFIKWSKIAANKNHIFISTPVMGTTGASVGKVILIIAEPIYFDTSYKGTVALRLLINDFNNAFIAPLTLDADENTFVIDTSGVLIAGNDKLLNTNLFSLAKKQSWPGAVNFSTKLTQALKQKETQVSWQFQSPGGVPQNQLVGISQIDIPNTNKDLFFVVTTAENNVTTSLAAIKNYGFIWLGFGVITTFLGGIFILILKR